MRKKDSTKTRVAPLFDYIGGDVEKLNRLLSLFDKGLKIEPHAKVEIIYDSNLGRSEEKSMPPAKSLLIWMIENVEKLNSAANKKSEVSKRTYEKRKRLFEGDEETKREALDLLVRKENLPTKAWYIFEGSTSPDIVIETDDAVFVGEGKRTEPDITSSTTWLANRDQLIRHVDSFLNQSKQIYSFYILEKAEYNKGRYKQSMKKYLDRGYFAKSLPHRDDNEIDRAFQSFVGFIFWEDIADCFEGLEFPEKSPHKGCIP